jgi:hypothetical protein
MTLPAKQFQRRDEDFECVVCGRTVRGSGYTNHCPECLTSLHVDIQPGDRANPCGGVMDPVGARKDGKKGFMILHRCRRCSHEGWNRSAPGDDFQTLCDLSAGG